MDECLAWLVFPLAALVVCTGLGLLTVRLARAELHPAAIPGLGFAAAIVLLGPLCASGAGATAGLALLGAAAVAGFATGRKQLPRPRLGAVAGVAVYALYIAPVALSGRATFLGYNLLNDTAIHLALVDWIGDHGSRWLNTLPPSSYAATIADYVRRDYPLGSHELLAALRPIVGLDPALVYQPFISLAAGLAASSVYALLRGGRAAALIAFAALSSQLVFSFALQGSVKELPFIACLAAAAVVATDVRLLAIPAAALYAIYGVYALPWILPLALLALVLARPGLQRFAIGVGVFVAAIAVDIPGSIHYWRHGHDVITRGSELGPLAGPLKPIQAAGIWLTGDYRFTPANHVWVTYALIAFALALALVGIRRAIRAERAALVLLASAFVAWAVSSPESSPYIDAKLLAILSPAVVLATCLGIGALPWRRIAVAAAVVIGGALLVSDALAYRVALLAPMDRLDELASIDKRFAGKGPILVNEFEEYVKHFMRRSQGSDPYEHWTAGHAELRDASLPLAAHAYDLDDMTTAFVERWPLIALRRSPAESRPPSNYKLAWSGRFYEVWRRTGPPPAFHLALGPRPLDPTFHFYCGPLHRLGRLRVIVAVRPAPIVARLPRTGLPPGWYPDAADPLAIDAGKGGSITASASTKAGGLYRVWLRGRAFRRDRVSVDGRSVGIARGLNGPNQWLDVGAIRLAAGAHTIRLDRPTRSLRPGDAQKDVIGPFELAPQTPTRLVSGAAANRACGRARADWVDEVR